MIQSVYIVRTNIIPLGNIPLRPPPYLRKAFRAIFENTECFADMNFSFPQMGDMEYGPLIFVSPSDLFIRDIGQLRFDTRSIRVGRPRTRVARLRLAALLAKRTELWNPARRQFEKTVQIENRNRFFGYDYRQRDQRLNYLYFETQPLHIKAIANGRTAANGKVFIHIYPSGFVVIHLAISIKLPPDQSIEEISRYINECHPLRYDSEWMWNTRVASGKLPNVIKAVKRKISLSLFKDPQAQLDGGIWCSAFKLATTLDAREITPVMLKGQVEDFDLGVYEGRNGSSKEALIISRRTLICLLSPYRKRVSSIHLFWRIAYLYHFAMIKAQVYEAYSDYLNREVERLKEYRLNPIGKFTNENVRQLFVYNPLIPRYLNALDRFIQPVPPFYRRVYAAISDGSGFNSKRTKMMDIVKSWEMEVEQWEHPVTAVWKKLISPLRSLLGL